MKKHSSALDGLRWFAFLGVFLFHANNSAFLYGAYGVQIFFVLSGFLIGRILLALRDDPAPLRERLKSFYIRRTLRIFPLYYFVLLLLFVTALVGLTHDNRQHLLPYHALYLTNFYIFFTGEQIDSHTHFWSLDVEEHFYLLAPFALLVFSLKRIEKGIIGIVLLIMAARIVDHLWFQHPKLMYLSPMQFDILGIGIAAAFIEQKGSFATITRPMLYKVGQISAMGLVVVMLGTALPLPFIGLLHAMLFPPLLALATAAFILMLWTERWPLANRLLSWGPWVYLGRISYGLYVYHNFLFVISRNSTGSKHVLMTCVALVATIVVSALSWHLLENPVNNLKRLFPYKTTDREARAEFGTNDSSPVHLTEQATSGGLQGKQA